MRINIKYSINLFKLYSGTETSEYFYLHGELTPDV